MPSWNFQITSIFGVALLCTVVYGTPTHPHLRHHGMMLQDALRERLGLNPTTQDSNNNLVDGQDPMQMHVLPPAEDLLNKMMTTMQNRHEHYHRRLMASPLLNRFGGDKFGNGDDVETEMHAYRRILMSVLNHMMQNLQTVQGGQEAARWITALRGSATQYPPNPPTKLISATPPSQEAEATEIIRIIPTSTSTSTTTPSSSTDNDEENKVKFNP